MEADTQADHIRQNIESTRAALDEKLDLLETKARETFDWKHQVSERPWVALGLALAAGYVAGSLGGDDQHDQEWDGHAADRSHTGGSVRSVIDSELNMLKGAAIGLLSSYARDALREYMPKLRETIGSMAQSGGEVPSSAPNNSFQAAAQGLDTNSQEIPASLETRYGQPPAPANTGSEYFDVAPTRTGRPTQSEINQTHRYNQ